MSVLEFLGEILPWPASKRPEDIQLCKSRLILQADALYAAIGTDAWERTLAHACDRGAAEWEHWLLTNHEEPPEERERSAHSALTLAQRSGDWELVGKILGTWRKVGASHKRFYRDAAKAYERHMPAFEADVPKLKGLGVAITFHPDEKDARRLLSLTEHYAERGGPWIALHLRAEAHALLGEEAAALCDQLAACIANPLDERIAWRWFTRRGTTAEPIGPQAEVGKRALRWFDQSGLVHAGALFLANRRQAIDGPPSEALIESALKLPQSQGGAAVLKFVVENAAWALVSRGELARAEDVLADAIARVPGDEGLAELYEATARLRSAPAQASMPKPSSARLVEINERFAAVTARASQELSLPIAA